jgi:hypothetical protein
MLGMVGNVGQLFEKAGSGNHWEAQEELEENRMG